MYLGNQVARPVVMHVQIHNTEDRVSSIRREYYNKLQAATYNNIIEEILLLATIYVRQELKPHQIYRKMVDFKKWKKKETFHEQAFNRLVSEVESNQ